MSLVSIRGLTVTYEGGEAAHKGRPLPALTETDFDIATGERLAVIGESGSGKSTLALAIAGLLPASATIEGKIEWPGLRQNPVHGRDIGFVFQDPAASLDPVLTIGEQMAEVARTHLGLGWKEAYARAADLLGRVRLPDPRRALAAYPHQLSGGQKQRVCIAAAIAAGPKLLIADEATSALDTIVQAEIVTLLRRLTEEDGMTLVFISHDIALAAGLADRIAVFRHGRTVEIGPAAQVIEAPRHAYTRALLDAHIGLDAAPLVARTAGTAR
jgi:peptide/nickel transport system ATP-binding protein